MWTPCYLFLLSIGSVLSTQYAAAGWGSTQPPQPPQYAYAELVAGADPKVTGTLTFTSFNRPMTGVIISGILHGLAPGPHGFHVHVDGAVTDKCKDAKAHFNPDMAKHSGPKDESRHAGDLGNVYTPNIGPTEVYIIDTKLSLGDGGEYDIANRSVVIHEKEDDLGRGGDEESAKTGNAGPRLACAVIKLIQYGHSG